MQMMCTQYRESFKMDTDEFMFSLEKRISRVEGWIFAILLTGLVNTFAVVYNVLIG